MSSIVKYMLNFIKRAWLKTLRIILSLNSIHSDWQVGWVNLKDNGLQFYNADPSSHWIADPFLYPANNELFMFVEYFDKSLNKGLIAFGKMVDNKVENFEICLEEDFHLSFPRVVKINSAHYLTVESSNQPGIRIYATNNFPFEWKLLQVYEKDAYFVDPIMFVSDDDIFILATSKTQNKKNSLFLYKIQSLDSGKLESSPSNPISVKHKYLRNAGFFQDAKHFIRVSQRNFLGIYGFDINLHSIPIPLNYAEYLEFTVPNLIFTKPSFAKQFHTLNKSGDYIVFDFKS